MENNNLKEKILKHVNVNKNSFKSFIHNIKNLSFDKALSNPYLLSIGVFVIAFLLLFITKPPIVKKCGVNTYQDEFSVSSAILLSIICAVVVLIANYFLIRT